MRRVLSVVAGAALLLSTADVTDPNAPLYCPYTWTVEKGDIRIQSGA